MLVITKTKKNGLTSFSRYICSSVKKRQHCENHYYRKSFFFNVTGPSLESDADTQESEPVTSSSVFRRAREVREKQQEAKNAPGR